MFHFQQIAVNFENLEAGNGYKEIQMISVLSLCSSLSLGNWIVVLDKSYAFWLEQWVSTNFTENSDGTGLLLFKGTKRCFVGPWKQLQTGACDMTKRGVPSDKTLQYACKNGDRVNFTLENNYHKKEVLHFIHAKWIVELIKWANKPQQPKSVMWRYRSLSAEGAHTLFTAGVIKLLGWLP